MNIVLAEVLIEIKEKRSLSLKKIASDCGIPPSVLHGWINGTIPSAKNLHLVFKLAKYLGLEIDELLFGQRIINDGLSKSIHSSVFTDGNSKYLLKVVKISE